MIKKVLIGTSLLLMFCFKTSAQDVALKTNALYWATTTPNMGIEAAVGKKHTLQLFYGLNPWKQSDGDQTNFAPLASHARIPLLVLPKL